MSADPEYDAPHPYLRVVNEEPAGYDSGERRPTPGEAAGGERHVRIPYAVFTCPGMSHGAILLYGWLQQHNGDKGCFPSQSVLAEELGGGERSVRRYLAELEAAGFVRAKVRRGIGGGGSFATAYDLYPDGDAPTNRPKDADEPANVAVSRDEPAKNDRRTGQKVQDEPAKNDVPIKDESNPVNQTSVIKDSAPTERRAPRPKPAAKVAETPKEPTPTVEAKPTEATNVPPSKQAKDDAAAPKAARPNKFGAVLDGIRALGVEPVYSAGSDAKAVKECSESSDEIAAAYVGVRRGEWGSKWLLEHPSIRSVCADMPTFRAWKEARMNGASDGKAGAAGGPDQTGRPGRTADLQGVPRGDAESKERAERAEQWQRNAREQLRRALAAKEAGTVPGMPVPRG